MESVQARRWGDNVLGASTFIEGGGDQLCMVFTWWGGGGGGQLCMVLQTKCTLILGLVGVCCTECESLCYSLVHKQLRSR